jgi:hypothetical protein
MNTINPNPGDDFCNLTVAELHVEIDRGLDRVKEGNVIVEDGESWASAMLHALYRLEEVKA